MGGTISQASTQHKEQATAEESGECEKQSSPGKTHNWLPITTWLTVKTYKSVLHRLSRLYVGIEHAITTNAKEDMDLKENKEGYTVGLGGKGKEKYCSYDLKN